MPAPALLVLLALTCARAGSANLEAVGCQWGGRWWAEGAGVRVRDACLRCRCARGALSCARAACAPAPALPPRRCALLHRRGACCPELHCPDGVRSLELEAEGRTEEDSWDAVTPAAHAHTCAEDGGVFAAGSALAARAACEHCFCLRGARRCVRPRCLPPPPGCAPRPAPGRCCPERYYCTDPLSATSATTSTPGPALHHRPHDCKVNGEWMREGQQVPAALAGADNCSQCFCLRGAARCQPAACARALHGCTPLLRPGHCCPHQYHCPHISDNALAPARNEERSLRSSSTSQSTAQPQSTPPPAPPAAAPPAAAPPAAAPPAAAPPATTKVKRKTNDSPPKPSSTTTPSTTVTATVTSTTIVPTTAKTKEKATEPSPAVTTLTSTTDLPMTRPPLGKPSTEQPDGFMRVMLNGTINCTVELHNTTTMSDLEKTNDTEKIVAESEARLPAMEVQTAAPADIITRDPFAGDSFVVNVSSSLFANNSRPVPAPPAPAAAGPVSPAADVALTHNMSKKTKEDYDYDYTEPTLPPSLPNLKIIPFVAADAVVDEDEAPKETYPVLEREDKFPVYYPAPVPIVGHKKIPFATRREDVYHPTQYPVFVSGKQDDGLGEIPAAPPTRPAAPIPPSHSTSEPTMTTPEVNLFSPPAETEGGFIPKGPGPGPLAMAEYFAVYPSTPPPTPHLTTSMQINPSAPDNMECVTADGRRVADGESVWVGCAACACAWAELHCAPRRCPAPPPHCRRRPIPAPPPASAGNAGVNVCCGELICDYDNVTMPAPTLSSRRPEPSNESKVPTEIPSEVIPFDPPADRRPPEPATSTNRPNSTLEREQVLETSLAINSTVLKNSYENPLVEQTKITEDSLDTQRPPTMTSSAPFTSKEIAAQPASSPAPLLPSKASNDTSSEDYEEEEDDEGFSFGSVLKLLLSDSYESSTPAPTKKKPVAVTPTPAPTPTTPQPAVPRPPSRLPPSQPHGAIPSFVPMQPHAYIPPKKVPAHNALNRIDHLVLGEATAIRKSTPRPPPTTPRPATTTRRLTTRATSRKPTTTASRTTTARVTQTEETTERYTPAPPPSAEPPRAPVAPPNQGGGGGLLKLAGCNIYGRMYRVGRIIAELSTPCQECRCTELGVQCTPLHC